MKSITHFITRKLRLKVNEDKSSVGRPWSSKYLGFSFTNSHTKPNVRLHWKTVERLKDTIREITKRKAGRSLRKVIDELNQALQGWWAYFHIIESKNRLSGLGSWIRRRLRAIVWTQWKNRRTRVKHLEKLGISKTYALKTGCSRKGAWRMSQVKWVMIALNNQYFNKRDLNIPWT